MYNVENLALRNRSGNITSDSLLVNFLYILLRDYITAGVVEEIVQRIRQNANNEISFTNGYLAQYALDIEKRLLRK